MDVACAVIGAGPAGLAVSAALRERGIEHVLLERGRAGQSWRTQRWDTFRLNTPGHMNVLLGADQPAHHYADLDEVLARLDALAASAPVREGVRVRRLSPTDAGLTLETDQGTIRARTVVIATGDQNIPRIPRLARDLPDRVAQLHTAGYRNAAALPEGAVLVVGSAQSGCQIAEDLLAQGREVWLATSPAGRMPARHRGSPTFSQLVEQGFFDQRPQDLPDPAMAAAAQPIIGAGGRGLSLQSLARSGAHLVGRLAGVSGERVGLRPDVAANIAAGDAFAERVRALLDEAALQSGAPAGHAAEDDPTEGPVEVDALEELDLKGHGIGSLIWATGFTGNFSWLPPEVLDEYGGVRYEGVASALPGVWLAGMKWLVNRSSGILRGMPADAAVIAEAVGVALRGASRAR